MPDIHRFKEKTERKIELLKTDTTVSERNKADILRFVNDCYAERLSHGRVYKLLYFLLSLSRMLGKDFADATKEDLKELIRKIENSPKNYTENTKKDFRVVLKKFYKWLEGIEDGYPDRVKWMKATIAHNHRKLPDELLTQDEIRQMIQAADNPRDKALVFVMYESGCRIGELLSIKLKHVQFDTYGAKVMVSGKTGARQIRLIASCDYLRYWLENHPDRSNPDAPLWASIANAERGTFIGYACVRKRVRDIARRAGITKKVNPHNFRHSRATHLASKLKTAQLCVMFGWEQHSAMPSTYIHLSGEDVDDALLKVHGLKKDSNGDTINCPRCQKAHQPTAKYCDDCGMPFNVKVLAEAEDERSKYDDLMSKLMANPDVKKAIAKALEEMK